MPEVHGISDDKGVKAMRCKAITIAASQSDQHQHQHLPDRFACNGGGVRDESGDRWSFGCGV